MVINYSKKGETVLEYYTPLTYTTGLSFAISGESRHNYSNIWSQEP